MSQPDPDRAIGRLADLVKRKEEGPAVKLAKEVPTPLREKYPEPQNRQNRPPLSCQNDCT